LKSKQFSIDNIVLSSAAWYNIYDVISDLFAVTKRRIFDETAKQNRGIVL